MSSMFPGSQTPAAHAACLVLDIHLPGLSGFELRRELARSGAVIDRAASPWPRSRR
jgi:FixJ family two-component response regulator